MPLIGMYDLTHRAITDRSSLRFLTIALAYVARTLKLKAPMTELATERRAVSHFSR